MNTRDSNEFVWDEEKVRQILSKSFEAFSRDLYVNYDKVIKAFKEGQEFPIAEPIASKQSVSLDWEIISSFHKKHGVMLKTGSAYLNEAKALADPDTSIRSVKRLSDGEVFTVGDTLDVSTDWSGSNFTIGSFFVNGEVIIASPDKEMRGYELKTWRKAKQPKPLFRTEDGVDIYEGNEYWFMSTSKAVNSFIQYHCENAKKDTDHTGGGSWKYFSTKEKAEEYILLNKPVLSVNDVLIRFTIMEFTPKNLKELAKSKL